MAQIKYKYNLAAEQSFVKVATFVSKPEGILIFDSYNNDWFPMKIVQIDKNDFSLRVMKDEFHMLYGGNSITELFLPHHYNVEMIGKGYYPLVTRPITYKSLIPGYENYITICITGDTHTDIYSPEVYKVIANLLIAPLHHFGTWHLTEDTIKYHNLGDGFKIHQLQKNLK